MYLHLFYAYYYILHNNIYTHIIGNIHFRAHKQTEHKLVQTLELNVNVKHTLICMHV